MPKTKSKFKFSWLSLNGLILLVVGLLAGFLIGKSANTNFFNLKAEETEIVQEKPDFPLTQTVTRIINGNTVKLENGRSVRLTAVSAPELKEKYGDKAKAFLEGKLLNKQVGS